MDARQQRFLRLVEPHHAAALAFARCLCRSDADGDDLFQVALLRAFDNIEHLRSEDAFRSWFYRVIVSVHRNRLRRPFWRRLVPLADDHGTEHRFDEELAGAQRARLALAELPPEQRETLLLFEIEGWTVDEIASLHHVSVSAVKSRLVRARDRLRNLYTKRFGAPAPAALPSTGGTR
jgi:RNA polymerase sigma-70 factor (ECF subfamily)